ncbi:Predicted arabinose efflux permease, MFS family [Clostridium acidisoli DSM 12555]|uniref:Predicted arabinose efflux permease, MFS family n=1 Tax=Clostridium acidisoli DSM 12555 TaxID=1121291 RepID=A0A1W1X4P0_9CLOT|nr:MFS transporter [Clostridium acidisoli]SMC18678.1 Predicted arabinose efflux permease, MFS family [Clostridium acidisoli DSM 12555]
MSDTIIDSNTMNRFPILELLALTITIFTAIMTETLPAGLLPQIGKSLGVSESLAGQLVTLYAIGSLIAAIPLITITRNWRRRPLLLIATCGLLIFNTITAISSNYMLTLIVRFFGGVFAGVLWGVIPGYARRMVSDNLKGRGLAIAMMGVPIALALGVPVGTFMGNIVGWHYIFAFMSILNLISVIWIIIKVPDYQGQSDKSTFSVLSIFKTSRVCPILFVIMTWILSHNIIYTYINPFLASLGMVNHIDLALFIFGISAIAGIWIVGIFIDRWLRLLVLVSIFVFLLDSILFGISINNLIAIYVCTAIWGLTFGGSSTLLSTALANTVPDEGVDIAMSISTTVWNLAIAGGGFVGGILLKSFGATSFLKVLFILLIFAFLIAYMSKKHGFTE